MAAPSQPLLDGLGRGWRWWTRELRGLLPSSTGTAVLRASPGLVVIPDGADLRLVDERPASRGRPRTEQRGPAVLDALSEVARMRQPPPVRLRLPFAQCFVRRVELPEAALEDAHRFLQLDLERATPFHSRDVYSAHFIEAARGRTGNASVSQVIVRREAVDRTIADIRSTGVALTAVDCWNETGTAGLPINFLQREASPEQAGGARLTKLLMAAAVCLAISGFTIAYSRHSGALAELTERTDAARRDAEAARRVSETSQAQLQAIERAERLKRGAVPAVEVIDRLTRLLPDTVWIRSLRLDGDRLEISGEAVAAAPLVALIENSGIFSDVAFSAPVTRNAPGGKERFSLSTRLAPPVPGLEPSGARP